METKTVPPNVVAVQTIDLTSFGFVDLFNVTFQTLKKSTYYNKDEDDISSDFEILLFPDPKATPSTILGDTIRDISDPSLGIGRYDTEGLWHACCDEMALRKNVCRSNEKVDHLGQETQLGRLMIDPNIYKGSRDLLSMTSGMMSHYYDDPRTPSSPINQDDGVSVQRVTGQDIAELYYVEQRGRYTLAFYNCEGTSPNGFDTNEYDDEHETQKSIYGNTIWVSIMTPQDIVQALPLIAILFLGYSGLAVWFYKLMDANRESRIMLEEWIFATILVALAQVNVDALYYVSRISSDSPHVDLLRYLGMVLMTCKRGIGRCLLMKLSVGWGIVKAHLEQKTLTTIMGLTITYVVLALLFEYVEFHDVSKHPVQNWLPEPTLLKGPILQLLHYVHFFVNITMLVWIPKNIRKTWVHLEQSEQTKKLLRYQYLSAVIALAIFLNVVEVFSVLFTYVLARNINNVELSVLDDFGFLMILACVAWLWQPNPSAQDYAHFEEVNVENDYLELELTEDMNINNNNTNNSNGLFFAPLGGSSFTEAASNNIFSGGVQNSNNNNNNSYEVPASNSAAGAVAGTTEEECVVLIQEEN